MECLRMIYQVSQLHVKIAAKSTHGISVFQIISKHKWLTGCPKLNCSVGPASCLSRKKSAWPSDGFYKIVAMAHSLGIHVKSRALTLCTFGNTRVNLQLGAKISVHFIAK